jgi:hypothetical protein
VLAATSAADAWSFGEKFPPYVPALEVSHFNGVSWIPSSFPSIPSQFARINSAYAISPNDVWAVGVAGSLTSGANAQLIYHWNGVTWSAVPHPKWPFFDTDVVYADAPNDVWIAGVRIFTRAFLAHWDGSTWTLRNAIYDVDDASGLAVFGPNDVWVSFIDVFNGENLGKPFVLHWDGSTIRKELLPPLGGVFPRDISGLAGVSSTDLWAVGDNANGQNYIAHHHFTWSPFIVSTNAQSMDSRSVVPFRTDYAVTETISQDTSNGGIVAYNGVDRWRLSTSPFAPASSGYGAVLLKSTTSFWTVVGNGQDSEAALMRCPANPPAPIGS